MRKPQMSPQQEGRASKTQWTGWRAINWHKAWLGVKSLQARIVKAAKAKRFHKAKALAHLLTRSFYGRLVAILRVTANKGGKTPGVDNALWDSPADKWQAVGQLKTKGYKAQPLKRKTIPKKNGKVRVLGIPTLKDRAMQALHKLALEPVAETLADPNSYGFRPRRSCADAIVQCHNVLCQKKSAVWVLEADIKSCFDNISHQWLTRHVPMDKKLLGQWLKAGYMDKGKWFPSESGTPQGGVISPTIANMALDGLEQAIYRHAGRRRGKNPWKVNLVRYADDFIVTCGDRHYLENEVKPVIESFLADRGMELSPLKTKVTHIDEGFDFLGFNIRKYKGKCLTKPSNEAVKGIHQKLRQCVKNHKAAKQEELARIMAPIIIGWAQYYKHSCAKNTFSRLDHLAFKLLWGWAKRRHPKKGKRWLKKKYFKTVGGRNWVFSDPKDENAAKLPFFDATKITRHTKIKAQANPYDKQWEAYFEQREASGKSRGETGKAKLASGS